MAARPGEENVATLFADVHYFYGPPAAKPPHHRFDKGSYVYLFENANERRARIEIANHPGTEDQDAFEGFLDRTHMRYSYLQQCLVSITVDGNGGSHIDPSQWHLPTYDPRNEIKYHYRLHSLDIYFWTHSDALEFVNGIRRILPVSQVEVADEPVPPTTYTHSHSQDVNPLVQKLENAAISDSRAQQPSIPSFAPPPTTSVLNSERNSLQSFVPMPYNPAAPPEAEKHQHREKTPPPPEDDGHNPLAAALARDQAAPMSPSYGQTNFSAVPGVPGFSGTPPHMYSGPMSPGQPPSQFGHMRTNTLPSAGVVASPGPYGANFPASPGFASPPPAPAPAPQGHPQPTPPPAVPNPGLPAPPPAPPGGYSQFNYANTHQAPAPTPTTVPTTVPAPATATATADYSIHQQLYRPTEHEQAPKYGGYKPKVETQSKLGQNAERLERGVTGILKKFEKKFG
ncbi:hypothetical protein GGR50DRAFT_554163 [Xylaria sp. CBS 124048]|nr:hypothetical protein GGR50DRAFT_554163 [Xylaria sp. CBS 124048]